MSRQMFSPLSAPAGPARKLFAPALMLTLGSAFAAGFILIGSADSRAAVSDVALSDGARPEAALPPSDVTVHRHADGRIDSDEAGDRQYALFVRDREDVVMSADTRELAAARKLRTQISGDYLWVREGAERFVIDDPALLQKVIAAWQEAEPVSEKMSALGKEMEQHGTVMQKLGEEMRALHEGLIPMNADINAHSRAVARLAGDQARLAHQLAALQFQKHQFQSRHGDEASDEMLMLDREIAALDRRMKRMEERMRPHEAALTAMTRGHERIAEPSAAIAARMDEAGKPMHTLGEQMGELGEQMAAISKAAHRTTQAVIDEAVQNKRVRRVDSL